MEGLTGRDILSVWERGAGQGPVDRALTILAAACPGAAVEDLAGLSVGRRDALLFAARARTFGPALDGRIECPACGERLEFSLDVGRPAPAALAPPEHYALAAAGFAVQFRLADSRDLAAIVDARDVEAARLALLRRCVLAARDERSGREVALEALPAAVLEPLAARMGEADAGADGEVELSCPACQHGWSAELDIAAFFWTEIAAQAQRLLREVDALARAYGWREAEILALSATRRQAYLELVAG